MPCFYDDATDHLRAGIKSSMSCLFRVSTHGRMSRQLRLKLRGSCRVKSHLSVIRGRREDKACLVSTEEGPIAVRL